MRMRKYWREIYLTVMVLTALAIILAASVFLAADPALLGIAAGVFVAVLGVGFYDQWHDAETVQVRVKTRR